MANRIDLMLSNNDIIVDGNDMQLIESDDQHIADTINSCPGWWKENPADGVAIQTFLKGRNVEQELARKMKIQLLTDNYVSRPIISYDSSKNLTIDPNVSL